MKNKNKSIIVVGAGIVGVSTALWLQKQGEEVILIDSSQPGTGASFVMRVFWPNGQWYL